MNSSTPAGQNNIGFWIAASLIIALSAGLAASFWPIVVEASREQSSRLVEAGKQARGAEAQLDFELASRLNPANQSAALELAKLQLATGQSQTALATLKRAGEGTEVLRLSLRTYLELSQAAKAADLAGRLATTSPANDDIALATLAYIVANQPDKAASLIPRLSSPEAARRLVAAQSYELALARELYSTGLLSSSQRILTSLPASVVRNLLLASILYARGGTERTTQARDLYAQAVQLEPSNLEARQGLVNTFHALGDQRSAGEQTQLLQQLKAGRP